MKWYYSGNKEGLETIKCPQTYAMLGGIMRVESKKKISKHYKNEYN